MRLLDVGCGWGGMVLHAAAAPRRARGRRHRLAPPGRAGREARRRGRARRPGRDPAAGLPRRRRRPVRRDQLDRHVRARRAGAARRRTSTAATSSSAPAGRLLNHAHQPAAARRRAGARRSRRFAPQSFIDRYVFPDGELHEVGAVVSAIQQRRASRSATSRACASTTRSRCARGSRNLEANWDAASPRSARAGPGSGASTWRRRRCNFEANGAQVHQVLAVRPDGGDSGLQLRPRFEGPA